MIEAMKQALEALEGFIPYLPLKDKTQCNRYDRAITSLRQAIAKLESQEPVECDEDFPEGFDKSLGIPAQALRQANAALCEVTNNRMWDVPALAERMLMFCKNTHPPQRKPLTDEQIEQIENGIWRPEFFDDVERQANREFVRAIEAAHGIKE